MHRIVFEVDHGQTPRHAFAPSDRICAPCLDPISVELCLNQVRFHAFKQDLQHGSALELAELELMIVIREHHPGGLEYGSSAVQRIRQALHVRARAERLVRERIGGQRAAQRAEHLHDGLWPLHDVLARFVSRAYLQPLGVGHAPDFLRGDRSDAADLHRLVPDRAHAFHARGKLGRCLQMVAKGVALHGYLRDFHGLFRCCGEVRLALLWAVDRPG